jgi:hypothetical protein
LASLVVGPKTDKTTKEMLSRSVSRVWWSSVSTKEVYDFQGPRRRWSVFTPLQGRPLQDIRLHPMHITRGLDRLRDMKSLKTIGIEGN